MTYPLHAQGRPLPRRGLILLLFSWGWGCGAPQPQSEACRRFVACVRALDAQRGRSTNVDRFLPGGACWGGVAGARLCTEGCERGLPILVRDVVSVPEACAP